jgi:hypothetical protein
MQPVFSFEQYFPTLSYEAAKQATNQPFFDLTVLTKLGPLTINEGAGVAQSV